MRETFECRNCYHSGPLNKHGRCEACGSESVISQEAIFPRAFLSAEQNLKLDLAALWGIPSHLIGRA